MGLFNLVVGSSFCIVVFVVSSLIFLLASSLKLSSLSAITPYGWVMLTVSTRKGGLDDEEVER